MLIDSMLYDHIAYRKYDSYFSDQASGHTPSSGYGVARMCSWDYDPKLDSFRHTGYNKLTNYSEDCIRHIYDQVSDCSRYSWATLTAFIITLSSLGVIAEILQLVKPDFWVLSYANSLHAVFSVHDPDSVKWYPEHTDPSEGQNPLSENG